MRKPASNAQRKYSLLTALKVSYENPRHRVTGIVPDVNDAKVREEVLWSEAALIRWGLRLDLDRRFLTATAITGPPSVGKSMTLRALYDLARQQRPPKQRKRMLPHDTIPLQTAREPRITERPYSREYDFITLENASMNVEELKLAQQKGLNVPFVYALRFSGSWYMLSTSELERVMKGKRPVVHSCCLDMAYFLKMCLPTLNVKFFLPEWYVEPVEEVYIKPRPTTSEQHHVWRFQHGVNSVNAIVNDTGAIKLADEVRFVPFKKDPAPTFQSISLEIARDLAIIQGKHVDPPPTEDEAEFNKGYWERVKNYRNFILDHRKEIDRRAKQSPRAELPPLFQLHYETLNGYYGADLAYEVYGPGVNQP